MGLEDISALHHGVFYREGNLAILNMDATAAAEYLKDKTKIDCIITSPPYYGQRDYGVEGQIGLEDHPDIYLKKLVGVFNAYKPILNDTGSLWVNLGDTYWSGKYSTSVDKKQVGRVRCRPQDKKGDGKICRPKQLLLIPHRFAIAMQDEGWILRNDIVWVKPNPIPDPVADRCQISHEYIFHFVKKPRYFYNKQAVGIKTKSGTLMTPLDTWQIEYTKGDGVHRAAFAEELVRIPILATCPPGGVVLDPFNGSGTTLRFAKSHGISAIGIDIKTQYCQLAKDSLSSLF